MFTAIMEAIAKASATAASFLLEKLVIDPVEGFVNIFAKGIDILGEEGVNPIVALANMGIKYVNYAMTAWVETGLVIMAMSAIPYVQDVVVPILLIFMPLFYAWTGVMLAIGFITAYYVPFLPYILFTLGVIGWLMAVIEGMVMGPLMALGIAHPEGHDALGKSEQGFMILLNIFLRPSMMIIGYIAAISLSYVGVWVMNSGFENVLDYMQGDEMWGQGGYVFWAALYGYFFASLLYTSLYLTIVQKAFVLIHILPDKVMRAIGGQAEQVGEQTAQWAEEAKTQMKEGGDKSGTAAGQSTKQQAAGMAKLGAAAKGGAGRLKDKLMGGGPGAGIS